MEPGSEGLRHGCRRAPVRVRLEAWHDDPDGDAAPAAELFLVPLAAPDRPINVGRSVSTEGWGPVDLVIDLEPGCYELLARPIDLGRDASFSLEVLDHAGAWLVPATFHTCSAGAGHQALCRFALPSGAESDRQEEAAASVVR